MSGTKIHNPPNNLEQILGFKMDCPRCRAWDLFFRSCNRTVNIRCKQCGLELIINIESLVKYLIEAKSMVKFEDNRNDCSTVYRQGVDQQRIHDQFSSNSS